MSNFIKFERVNPEKRDVLQRLKDYKEVYQVFTKHRAIEQADRCMQYGDPYCHTGCPLGNHIPAWLKQTTTKNPELTFALSNRTSPFPEVLGRICPQDVLCEGACPLNTGHGAIPIGAIETYISENAFEKGIKSEFRAQKNGRKVAIIDSGSSGISAATFLLRRGFEIEIFERANRTGGLFMHGVPGLKLNKEAVTRRVNWLIEAGMKLHSNCETGKDKKVSDLGEEFNAIHLGIGAASSNKVNIEDENASNVHFTIDFSTDIQRRNLGDKNAERINVEDRRVVVIDGGDTAMNCIRTSVREGAQTVKCLYRRDKVNMPGSKKEVVNAKEEGAGFVFNVSPRSIKVKDNSAFAVELLETSMSEPDGSGRQKVVVNQGSEYLGEADVVILALGFPPEVPTFLKELNVETNSWDAVVVNSGFKTSNKKVHTGGDCQRGAHLVVTVAADGREATKAIIKDLL